MNRVKRLWIRLAAPVGPFVKIFRGVLPPALPVVLPACLLLFVLCLARTAVSPQGENLWTLLETALFMPVFAAACACALARVWNRSGVSPALCAQTVKAVIWRVLATGLCAALGINVIANLLTLLPRLVSGLLGWIPLVGSGVKAAMRLIAALLEIALDTARPVCLAAGETALIAWGLWGVPQAREALRLLWGGRTDTLPVLILLALCRLASQLLVKYVFHAALIAALLESLFDALCVVCAVVLCLREHERQHGWTL